MGTKQSNKRVAEQIESARKTALAKGEAGIKQRPDVPTLAGFEDRFIQAIETRCCNKTNTFYKEKFRRLLEYAPLARATLNDIDEHLIERYVQARRKKVGIVSVHRALATLRRALGLAHEWTILDRVPRIRLLAGEPIRDFVPTRHQEHLCLSIATQPLHDFVVLVTDTGLRLGEALSLEWRDVHLDPSGGARFGYIRIRDGKAATPSARSASPSRQIHARNAPAGEDRQTSGVRYRPRPAVPRYIPQPSAPEGP